MGTRARHHTGACLERFTMASVFTLAARRLTVHSSFRSALTELWRSPNAVRMQPLHWQQHPRMYTSIATAMTSSANSQMSPWQQTSAPYLEGLNAEQLEAVVGPIQSTRVVAGPGSGKASLAKQLYILIYDNN